MREREMQVLRRFKTDERGAIAVVFALVSLPLLGMAGAAVDYSRAANARTELQKAADAAALRVVSTRRSGDAVDVQALVGSAYGDRVGASTPQAQGGWNGGRASFTVTASTSVPTTLFSLFVPSVPVSVSATAEAIWTFTKTEVEGFNMSPEAADYNELYAYCYNQGTRQRLGPVDPASLPRDGSAPAPDQVRRLPFQKIADNSDAGVARRPGALSVICGPNEVASYHLRNVRDARTNPSRQGSQDVEHNRPCGDTVTRSARFGETWLHYTDSTLARDAQAGSMPQFNTCYRNLIETIVCDRREQCLTRAKGGELQDFMGKERDPQVTTRACAPGRFIYFGWEDRPPGIGQWTDRDYDDIRLTVSCPTDLTPMRGPARIVS